MYQLANARIGVWSYSISAADKRQTSLMHNKFALFDNTIGNRPVFIYRIDNFTKRANERNQENVVILDNKNIIERYLRQFEI